MLMGSLRLKEIFTLKLEINKHCSFKFSYLFKVKQKGPGGLVNVGPEAKNLKIRLMAGWDDIIHSEVLILFLKHEKIYW